MILICLGSEFKGDLIAKRKGPPGQDNNKNLVSLSAIPICRIIFTKTRFRNCVLQKLAVLEGEKKKYY